MAKDRKSKNEVFKVYIRPQSISDCFIATMDPKNPFKICLYPSTKTKFSDDKDPENSIPDAPDELDQLILHNYLLFKRDCLR